MIEDYIKYIIIGIIFISLIILVKDVILKPQELKVSKLSVPFSQIKIDFKTLENLKIEDFTPFEEISFPKKTIGRPNPFEKY